MTASALSDEGVVKVIATVGLGNALRAGDAAHECTWSPGTINLAVLLPCPCEPQALAEALMLAQEARAVAVLESGVLSVNSGRPASGTGTDAAVVAAPDLSRVDEAPIRFVGKHTSLGAAIGGASLRAIRQGVREWLNEQGLPDGPSNAPLILVGGGVRSGKSAFAEARALAFGSTPAYVATAQAFDAEMQERIDLHQASRGDTFRLWEAPLRLAETLLDVSATVPPAILVDCLTLWVSNLLCAELSDGAIEERFDQLLDTAAQLSVPLVFVTNEVGLGIVPSAPMARRFRDLTGRLHQRLSAVAHEVHFAALGTVLRLHPGPVMRAQSPRSQVPQGPRLG